MNDIFGFTPERKPKIKNDISTINLSSKIDNSQYDSQNVS